jgi:GDPmannose 4,6-dehydratase
MQWLMLQQEAPEDFVIATGQQHSVREFIEMAAAEAGIELEWQGEGVDEKGIEPTSGNVIVEVDPRYFRPTEVETLLGDAGKAREKLGWKPRRTLRQMVAEMVASDLKEAERDHLCRRKGFYTFNHFE